MRRNADDRLRAAERRFAETDADDDLERWMTEIRRANLTLDLANDAVALDPVEIVISVEAWSQITGKDPIFGTDDITEAQRKRAAEAILKAAGVVLRDEERIDASDPEIVFVFGLASRERAAEIVDAVAMDAVTANQWRTGGEDRPVWRHPMLRPTDVEAVDPAEVNYFSRGAEFVLRVLLKAREVGVRVTLAGWTPEEVAQGVRDQNEAIYPDRVSDILALGVLVHDLDPEESSERRGPVWVVIMTGGDELDPQLDGMIFRLRNDHPEPLGDAIVFNRPGDVARLMRDGTPRVIAEFIAAQEFRSTAAGIQHVDPDRFDQFVADLEKSVEEFSKVDLTRSDDPVPPRLPPLPPDADFETSFARQIREQARRDSFTEKWEIPPVKTNVILWLQPELWGGSLDDLPEGARYPVTRKRVTTPPRCFKNAR